MVADDNNFVRFLIRRWLGDSAEIVEVEKGLDVVPTYQRIKPDILFLDIHLPGRSGKDILSDVLRLDPMAFVVMVSADSNRENVMHTVKNGARAFMTKPFTRTTLDRYYRLCPTIGRPDGRDLLGLQAGALVT